MIAGHVFFFLLLSSIAAAARGAVDGSREFGLWTWSLLIAFSIFAVLLVWWGRSRANRF